MSSLEFDSLFERGLKTGAKQQHLSDLAGVSASKVSRAVNGLETLDYPDLRKLERVIVALESICGRAAVPVDFREMRAIRKLVDEFYEPLTADEESLLARFSRGDSLADLTVDFKMTASQLLTRIGDLLEKSGRLHPAAK